MRFFKEPNIDFIGRRKYWIAGSAIMVLLSLASIFFWRGIPLGVDFRGGTLVYVKFSETPDENRIRQALDSIGISNATIQRYGASGNNEVLISLEQRHMTEEELDRGRQQIVSALRQAFGEGRFEVRNVEIVGPQVGKQLQRQAVLATLYSLAGTLIYLWFRLGFEYGFASVVAVFHDALVTVGAFSLLDKEISLTVIAALLTLIGYSLNDTIVTFDRVRENLKMMRREPYPSIVNRSINQTLSRTILTSGLTFLTVLSLFLFGGEVIHGFSFALVIGILVGTYSSFAVAAPIAVAYQGWRGRGMGRVPVSVAAEAGRRDKARVKA